MAATEGNAGPAPDRVQHQSYTTDDCLAMMVKQLRLGVGEIDDRSDRRHHDPGDADDLSVEVGNPSADADGRKLAEECYEVR